MVVDRVAATRRRAARSGWYVCTFSVCSGAFFGIGGSLGLSGCSSRSVPSDLARAEAAYFEVCISALTSGLDVGVWRGAQESLGGRRAYESASRPLRDLIATQIQHLKRRERAKALHPAQ